MSVTLSGVFPFRDSVLAAIARLRKAGYDTLEVMSPVPDHELLEAVAHKPSKVGLFTLLGGLGGLLTGFIGASWAHLHWGMIIGGKLPFSIPPFVIIAFELTVLLGATATLIGVMMLCGLPRTKLRFNYDYRVSEDHYVLVVETDESLADAAAKILIEAGGEVRL